MIFSEWLQVAQLIVSIGSLALLYKLVVRNDQ